jgi:hypothetical protein
MDLLDNPYIGFLNAGGDFALIDQDYFYANDLPDSGEFLPGTFPYDYLGIQNYYNDIESPDSVYYGISADPISWQFAQSPFTTYWSSQWVPNDDFHPDVLTVSTAEPIFFDSTFQRIYGCRYDNGIFKTVFLSFSAENSCHEVNLGGYQLSEQYLWLIDNIISWFDTPSTMDGNIFLRPSSLILHPCYPNPFNSSVALSFQLPDASQIELKIYDISGREVASIVNPLASGWSTGKHSVVWEAKEMPSGIYFVRLSAVSCQLSAVNGQSIVQKVVLLK